MYEKTGKIRRKKEGQVLGKRPLPMALLRFEKRRKKRANAPAAIVKMTTGSSGGCFAGKRASGYNRQLGFARFR
jgi:hypothetical protein